MTNKPKKIVVIDDSEVIIELVRETLTLAGYEVVAQAHPIGFFNLLRAQQPDLALVDVNMPGLRGDKLAEIAVGRGAPCPIVFFSDQSDAQLTKLVRVTGVAGYIRKTADMKALVASVEKFLKK